MSDKAADLDLVKLLQELRDNGYKHIRWLPDGKRYAATMQIAHTARLVVGNIGGTPGYSDCWCYNDMDTAKLALDAWDGAGEPKGWHRHPPSGRRVSQGDEFDVDGNHIPAGREYLRP